MSGSIADDIQHLYREHHGWLRTWLRQRVGCPDDAVDLMQDTFVSVLRSAGTQQIREPRPFLATVARRLMIRRDRRRKLELAYLDALRATSEELAPSPQHRLLALDALVAIDEALDGLPAPVREAFLLAHLEGLTYAEIAVRLGVSTSSVKQYLSRANRQCVFARLQGLDARAAYRSLSGLTSHARRGPMTTGVWLGAAAGIGALTVRSRIAQQLTADYRTRIGERQAFTLTDGTELLLNTASAVDVRFTSAERVLELISGEIVVTTGHGDRRPLSVATRAGRIRALGTKFIVREQEERIEVVVLEGAVEIRPAHAERASTPLRAGAATTFTAQGIDEYRAIKDTEAAWMRGLLIADDMRLDEFLAELGRYRTGHLGCDPAVAGLRFSGVFPLASTDQILALLPNSLPVRVVRRSRYWVVVEAA